MMLLCILMHLPGGLGAGWIEQLIGGSFRSNGRQLGKTWRFDNETKKAFSHASCVPVHSKPLKEYPCKKGRCLLCFGIFWGHTMYVRRTDIYLYHVRKLG